VGEPEVGYVDHRPTYAPPPPLLCLERSESSRLLRAVGFDAVLDEAKALLADEVVLTHWIGTRWRTDQVRPGGVRCPPHHYALWANRYVWALAHDARRPAQFIVEQDVAAGVFRTVDEVKQKVARLRPNYLTRAERSGLPGGELTSGPCGCSTSSTSSRAATTSLTTKRD
jgi:hypothetical protein